MFWVKFITSNVKEDTSKHVTHTGHDVLNNFFCPRTEFQKKNSKIYDFWISDSIRGAEIHQKLPSKSGKLKVFKMYISIELVANIDENG